jgi:hypothetical protein
MTPSIPATTADDRDEAILEHLRRYHLTTNEVLRQRFFPETNDAAVRKVVSRLIRVQKLLACRLFDNRKYYVLTPREAVARGEHRCIAQPFNYQGLVNAYAVLWFCTQQNAEIFTAQEFETKFPDLLIRGVRTRNYYLDRSEEPNRLAFILVDYGTKPEEIAKKIHRIISRGYTLAAFARLIQRGRFLIAILTPGEEKKSLIRAAIEANPPNLVKIRIDVVRELADILINRMKIRPTSRKPGKHKNSPPRSEQLTNPADQTPLGEE